MASVAAMIEPVAELITLTVSASIPNLPVPIVPELLTVAVPPAPTSIPQLVPEIVPEFAAILTDAVPNIPVLSAPSACMKPELRVTSTVLAEMAKLSAPSAAIRPNRPFSTT